MPLIAPFFKGIVDLHDPRTLALLTKRPRNGTERMSDECYVRLVRDVSRVSPEMGQTIARAAAAALLAAETTLRGETARLVAVEGCTHVVGDGKVTGGEIMADLWRSVLPHALTEWLPPPIIEGISACTLQEARAVLAHVPDRGSVQGVTHAYHLPRAEALLREEARPQQQVLPVLTPEQIVAGAPADSPAARFVRELVAAGAPDERTEREEAWRERMYALLHRVSRLGRCLTGGRYELEIALAERLRK